MLARLYQATDTILLKFIGDVKPINVFIVSPTAYYQDIFDLQYCRRKYVQKIS